MIGAGGREAARAYDAVAVKYGISSLLLMENASFSLYLQAISLIEQYRCDRVIAFVGRGGNGGDALALIRQLSSRGCRLPLTIVPLFDDSDNLAGDTATNWNMLPVGVEVGDDDLDGNPLIVDGITGTGLSRNLSDIFLQAVEKINDSGAPVLAIDIPTGLDSNTGNLLPKAVRATVTVSMGLLKQGLFFGEGPTVAGHIVLGAISAPEESRQTATYMVVEPDDVAIKKPSLISYKNKNGHALFVVGEYAKAGAAVLAARAFLRAGGGLATLLLPDEDGERLCAGRWPDLMLTTPEKALKRIDDWEVIVVGPGLSELSDTTKALLLRSTASVVCDAGMFDMFSATPELFHSLADRETVFTPHVGELSRFLNIRNDEPWYAAVDRFPLTHSQVLVAKNHASIVRTPEQRYIIPHGAAALAFAGSGDVLSGLCASFLVRQDALHAAIAAAMVHRQSGLLLEERFGRRYHSIESLLEMISVAIREFEL